MDQTRSRAASSCQRSRALVGVEEVRSRLETTMQIAEAALAAEQVAARSACSTTRSSTRRTACSLATHRSSRRSSTSAPTCCSTSSRPSRPLLRRVGRQERNDELPSPPASRSHSARSLLHCAARTSDPRASLTGSITRTSTSSAPRFRAVLVTRLSPRTFGPAPGHLVQLLAPSN